MGPFKASYPAVPCTLMISSLVSVLACAEHFSIDYAYQYLNSEQAHGFEEAMLKEQLAKLIAGGELAGTLKGGREYVPSAFVAMKSGELESFFADNGYISFDRARQLDVLDPLAALQAGAHQDCIGLDSCVVAGSALAQLEASLDEVLQAAQE